MERQYGYYWVMVNTSDGTRWEILKWISYSGVWWRKHPYWNIVKVNENRILSPEEANYVINILEEIINDI